LTNSSALDKKLHTLRELLKSYGAAIVAYSGGVDSSFLLAQAVDVLGGKALAITVISPLHPTRESYEANQLAKKLGARQLEVSFDETQLEAFESNPKDRCYHCKLARAKELKSLAQKEGISVILDGTNFDDSKDYRPGRRALKEEGVLSPLEECGITKAEVRELSRTMGLPTWNDPSAACLATRFPYGTAITKEGLTRIEEAEERLRGLGLTHFRLRDHGTIARLEATGEDILRVAGELRKEVLAIVKGAGFAYAALDLEGYRMGAMNETIAK
jgi:uncharacterized protein